MCAGEMLETINGVNNQAKHFPGNSEGLGRDKLKRDSCCVASTGQPGD